MSHPGFIACAAFQSCHHNLSMPTRWKTQDHDIPNWARVNNTMYRRLVSMNKNGSIHFFFNLVSEYCTWDCSVRMFLCDKNDNCIVQIWSLLLFFFLQIHFIFIDIKKKGGLQIPTTYPTQGISWNECSRDTATATSSETSGGLAVFLPHSS